jgi:hypothetical protein
MLKISSVELTDEEAKTIIQFLRTTPIHGTFDTLPVVLGRVASILKKIDTAFQDDLKEE